MGRITLVLGGARSGKSRFAQEKAARYSRVAYVATAQAGDQEMAARIKQHRKQRPAEWQTIESPLGVHENLDRVRPGTTVVIIDCLTLYVSNMLLADTETANKEALIVSEIEKLLARCKSLPVDALIVSNEVGCGIVPDNELARQFRDIAGRVNQLAASQADEVYFMVAGIPQKIK
jgi:adenosylcobinamide kinase/adenosylcobinamide-phosphate guanylyltransferase